MKRTAKIFVILTLLVAATMHGQRDGRAQQESPRAEPQPTLNKQRTKRAITRFRVTIHGPAIIRAGKIQLRGSGWLKLCIESGDKTWRVSIMAEDRIEVVVSTRGDARPKCFFYPGEQELKRADRDLHTLINLVLRKTLLAHPRKSSS